MSKNTVWEMKAWGESTLKGNEGKPAFWSLYTFKTEKEALTVRAKLEKRWKKEPNGPYVFDIYKVERSLVPRKK